MPEDLEAHAREVRRVQALIAADTYVAVNRDATASRAERIAHVCSHRTETIVRPLTSAGMPSIAKDYSDWAMMIGMSPPIVSTWRPSNTNASTAPVRTVRAHAAGCVDVLDVLR